MIHQLNIVLVIFADSCQVVGKHKAIREKMFIQAPATRHRITSDINYFGVGKKCLDQTNVVKITGCLIDKIRSLLPECLRVIQVSLCEIPDLLCDQLCHRFRVLPLALLIRVVQFAGDGNDFGEFNSRINLAMA